MENSELLKSARESLKGNWALAIVTYLVYQIIISAVGSLPGVQFLVLVIGGPFLLGISIFTLNLSRGQDARLEQIFDGFKEFGRTVIAYLLMIVYIFLWMLLLIIPGIIKNQ